ncbi:hypothetical protein HanIR_Chr10g0463981 [Helianthus annuus]|nr:hypothetical protein HanIR_Chr10g0463981 [Helianthus annuus]
MKTTPSCKNRENQNQPIKNGHFINHVCIKEGYFCNLNKLTILITNISFSLISH